MEKFTISHLRSFFLACFAMLVATAGIAFGDVAPGPNDPKIIKFTKKAELQCDKIVYTLHLDLDHIGAAAVPVTISDNWPAGTLPASTVTVTGTPNATPSTVLNASGWSVTLHEGVGAVLSTGSYDITFTTPVDASKFVGGQMDVRNQAFAQVSSTAVPSMDVVTGQNPTLVHINEADYKKCHGDQTGGGDGVPKSPNCLNGKIDVACGDKPGTYTITLHPQGNGGVMPDYISIVPPAGITLTPNLSSYPVTGGAVTVTVSGASLGQSLTFDVSGTTNLPGSVDGTNICCNGKITIEIPKNPCPPKVDIGITKTGATSPPPNVPWYTWTLNVTNEGAAYTPASGALVVNDPVPTGMTFQSYVASPGWTCNAPVTGPGIFHCTYTGGPLVAGPGTPAGTITVTAKAAGNGPFGPITNCAEVGIASPTAVDSNSANNRSCFTVVKPGTVEVKKVCDAPVQHKYPVGPATTGLGWFSNCHITVKTTGPQTGTISVNDVLTGGGTLGAVTYTPPTPPWTCAPGSCSINGAALNQTASTTTFDIPVAFGATMPQQGAENCASIKVGGAATGQKSCVKFPPPGGTVDVKKICEPATQIPGAKGYQAKCHITVTTTGPQSGLINVNDVITGNGTVSGVTCPAPWNSNGIGCSVIGGNLNQTASSTTFDVNVTFPDQGAVSEAKNCAKITDGGQGESCTAFTVDGGKTGLSITKKVTYNGTDLSLPGVSFPVTATCDASVSTINAGQTLTIGNLAAGTACTVTEGATPASATAFAQDRCGPTMTPVWTASYAPSQTVNAGPGANVTITNTLTCEKKDTGTVKVTKVCEPATQIPAAKGYQAKCHITVTTTGPQSGLINVNDVITGNGTVMGATCPFPWNSNGIGCSVIGGNLNQTASSTTFDVNVTFPDQGAVSEAKNCAKITDGGKGESCTTFKVEPPHGGGPNIDVAKTCSAYTQLAADGPWVAQCSVTVTATGTPLPPVISFSENLTDTGSHTPAVGIATGTASSEPWACNTLPATANTPVNCQLPSSALPASGVSTVNFGVYLPIGVKPGEVKNCATAHGLNASGSPLNPALDSQPACVDMPGTKAVTNKINIFKNILASGVPNASALSAVAFPVTATCDPAITSVSQDQMATTVNLAAGTPCTVTEGPISGSAQAAGVEACGAAGTPVWSTSYDPSQTVNAGPGVSVSINNKLTCEPNKADTGFIDISKKFDDQTPGHIGNPAFQIVYDCGAGPHILALHNGENSHVGPLPVSQNCWISEQQISSDTQAAAEKACGQGMKPVWSTTYDPAQNGVVGTTPTIVVNNRLTCEKVIVPPAIQQIFVKKVVVNKNPGLPVVGSVFSITSTCTPNTTSSNSPMTVGYTDGQTTIFGGALGDTCVISEDSFPQNSFCGDAYPQWTKTITPSATFVVGINNPLITVTNTFECVQYVNKSNTLTDPVCTANQHLENHLCVDNPLVCPPGTQKVGPVCVPIVIVVPDPICGQGQHLENHKCVDNPPRDPICGKNQHLENHKCVDNPPRDPICGRNQHLENHECVDNRPPPPRCLPPQQLDAATGKCHLVCRPGTHPNGNGGCAKDRPVCDGNQHYSPASNSCVDNGPNCKSGTHPNNKGGCSPDRPVCDGPTHYDPRSNSCVRNQVVCEPPQVNVRGRCVTPKKQAVECPPGFHRLGRICLPPVQLQIPLPGFGRKPPQDGGQPRGGGGIPGIRLP